MNTSRMPSQSGERGEQAEHDRIDKLADSYVERLRCGEHPSVTEYVTKYPELADEIRELFPALAMLEKAGNDESGSASTKRRGPWSEIPNKLGEYQILRKIGQGGMGVVYEAEHTTMRRHVALKVMPAEFALDDQRRQRFLHEARAAGRLHHTNIVPVFEVGEHEGVHYYAMQFIQGQSLDLVFEELKRLQAGNGIASHTAKRIGTRSDQWSQSVAITLLSGASQAVDVASEEAQSDRTNATGNSKNHGQTTTPTIAASPSVTTSGSAPRVGTSSSSLGHTEVLSTSSHDNYFRRVARIGLQSAEALDYAHGQGVLHRDIKPSNLILDLAGVIWLTDFGLAKNEDENLTRTGGLVGTLRYMAPERLNGQADARSDTYGLGLTLYELATLQLAFNQPDRGRLVRDLTQSDPISPRKINRHVPRDLETIILKAIDKQPHRRYKTAGAMADDLRLFLADRPVQARRISTTERVWRWCRRNPYAASLTAVVAALLTFVSVASTWFGVDSRAKQFEIAEQARMLDLRRREAQSSAAAARESEQRAKIALYDQYVVGAQSIRRSAQIDRREESLDRIVRALEILPELGLSPDETTARRAVLRDEAIASLAHVDLGRTEVGKYEAPWTRVVHFDSRLERYAQSDEQGAIVVRRTSDQQEMVRLPATGYHGWVMKFSPDGRYLAAKYHHSHLSEQPLVHVWNLGAREPVITLEKDEVLGGEFEFSPDSKRFAIALGYHVGVVRIYELPDEGLTAARVSQTLPAKYRIRDLCFNRGGDELIISQEFEPRAVIWNLTDETSREVKPPCYVFRFDWNDKLLVAGGADGNVYLYEADKLDEDPKVLRGHRREVVKVLANRAGDRIVSESWDGTVRVWDAHTKNEILNTRHGDLACDGFAPNDRSIGFVQPGTQKVWVGEILDKGPLQVLSISGDMWPREVTIYHPNHPRLIVSGNAGGLEFWDAQAKRRVASAPVRGVIHAMFSSDGHFLVASGDDGVLRWPIKSEKTDLELRIRVGPCESILPPPWRGTSLDGSGRWLVACQRVGRIQVVDLDRRVKPIPFESTHRRVSHALISPDTESVVTTAWHGREIILWDRATGKRITALDPDSDSAVPAFSPDGKWFAVSEFGRQRIWEVRTWNVRHELECKARRPRDLAFSPDSQILATQWDDQSVQLIEPESGRRLARLKPPELGDVISLVFRPDGTRLAVGFFEAIHLWNLLEIRQELRNIELDWELTPHPMRAVRLSTETLIVDVE